MKDEAKRIVAKETWEADGSFVIDMHVDEHGHDAGMVADMGTQVAATIAACAPEALRMLLDNEWAGGGEPSGYCLDCGAPQSAQHSEHCRWLSLMRKAGLR